MSSTLNLFAKKLLIIYKQIIDLLQYGCFFTGERISEPKIILAKSEGIYQAKAIKLITDNMEFWRLWSLVSRVF